MSAPMYTEFTILQLN